MNDPVVEGIVEFNGICGFTVPAIEGIALPGGLVDDDSAFLISILNCIGFGVVGIVHAAVQIVGDGVIHELPACVQRQVAFHLVGCKVDLFVFLTRRSTVPAGKFIAVPRRIAGGFLHRVSHIFNSFIPLVFRSVIPQVFQFCVFLPFCVEGHAFVERITREIYLFSGVIRREIPAEESVAFGSRNDQVQHGLPHPLCGIGESLLFAAVTGEYQFIGTAQSIAGINHLRGRLLSAGTPGIIGRYSFLPAEVHGDIHPPIGVEVDVLADLLAEVVRIALKIRIVVPACKGQPLNGGILRLRNTAVLRRLHIAIGAHVIVIIQAVHLIVLHAPQLDGDIVGRHGKRDRIAVGGVAQSLGIGAEAQVVAALQQIGGDDDQSTRRDGVQIRNLGFQNPPAVQAVCVGNGELPGNVA